MKCIKPIWIEMRNKKIPVPCGKCAWCLKRKRDEWFFRLREEKKCHKFSMFITLTYNDEHLPYHVDDDGVIHYDVSKVDIQKFVKSMRNDGYKLRYMINSEYIPESGRPHYHGILFSDDKIGIEPYWDKGFSYNLPARDSSLKYVVKYILKGSNVPEGSVPNFSLLSRRPGLGSSFVYKGEPYILDRGGVKLVPGHYYRRKYLQSLSDKMRDLVSDQTAEYLSQTDPLRFLRSVWEHNASQMDFETWLDALYKQDLKQQIKINRKK